jgi:predicted nicotinamide N-methyase
MFTRLERALRVQLAELQATNQQLRQNASGQDVPAVGLRVSAKWHTEDGYPGWFSAHIEAINDDGTFHLVYEDGGHWYDTPETKFKCDGGVAGARPESALTEEQQAAITRVYARLRAAQVDNAYTLTSSAGETYSVTVLEEMMVDVGTRVWDAALYLAQWCLDNPAAFEGSRCVEMGAGCAATGLFAAHVCREILLTDYTTELKNYIQDNITLNLGESNAIVTAVRLDWTETEVFINMEPCDVALGADIVYIPDLMADLIAATYNCLRPGGYYYGVSPGDCLGDQPKGAGFRMGMAKFLRCAEGAGMPMKRESLAHYSEAIEKSKEDDDFVCFNPLELETEGMGEGEGGEVKAPTYMLMSCMRPLGSEGLAAIVEGTGSDSKVVVMQKEEVLARIAARNASA